MLCLLCHLCNLICSNLILLRGGALKVCSRGIRQGAISGYVLLLTELLQRCLNWCHIGQAALAHCISCEHLAVLQGRSSGLDEKVLLAGLADGHRMEKVHVRPDSHLLSFSARVRCRFRNSTDVSTGQFL